MADQQAATMDNRKRRRRPADLERHRALIENVVSNLAYQVVAGRPYTRLVAMRSHREVVTRYSRPGFRQFAHSVDLLAAIGWLDVQLPLDHRDASTIGATQLFVSLVVEAGIGFEDFGRHESEEVIVLKRSRFDVRKAENGAPGGYRKASELVDYEDTPETVAFRQQVSAINQFLERADLAFASDCSGPDIFQRRLKRTFTIAANDRPRFDRNGRLFGGWWQNLKAAERHFIRIDGEAIADLDFASMFPRLAYLKLGIEPPEGDLYAVPGLEAHRKGVKEMMSTLLFVPGPKRGIPADTRPLLPKGWTLRRVREAILLAHPRLEDAFERGLGMELMFLESQILMAVLLKLMEAGITALPMHDGLMVTASQAHKAMEVMRAEAVRIVGFSLPISRKEIAC